MNTPPSNRYIRYSCYGTKYILECATVSKATEAGDVDASGWWKLRKELD
jgi:hypothetical protein